MSMEEYLPETWEALAPCVENTLSIEELMLFRAIRARVGGRIHGPLPVIPKQRFNDFLTSLPDDSAVF
jgi:hypothetical protein